MSYTLRKPTFKDIESIVKYANNLNVSQYTSNKFPYPYLVQHAEAFVDFANNTTTADVLAIDINGVFIGGCGLHFKEDLQCKNAEIGYWLAEPFWGKGIITSVINERVNDAFQKHNIRRVYASVFEENIASQKALLKCGFILEAIFKQAIFKNNKYHNDYIYSILNPYSST